MSKPAQLQKTLFNEDRKQAFLDRLGYTITSTVGQDSSIRRYFRTERGTQNAILMETVPDGSPHATPGHSLGDFVRISEWLRSIDLKAPEIYELDAEHGYALLEDFGDICFRDALSSGEAAGALYGLAADVLTHLSTQDCPLALPCYYESHVHKRHRRVVDWFMPLARARANEDGLVESYKAVWQEIEQSLPPAQEGFTHIDFHAQNLMWLPEEQGLKRCGILDFQGAMRGPVPYDFTNLLEDARTDVPSGVKQSILANLDEGQRQWFRILASQFHCRVIGQFIKQAALDDNASYLPHISRLQNYLAEGLKDPVLQPLAHWFNEQGIDFTADLDFSALGALKNFVHPSLLGE